MKSTFMSEFAMAAKQGPKLFFAPLVGAVNGVRDELRRIEEENAMRENPMKPLKSKTQQVDQKRLHL